MNISLYQPKDAYVWDLWAHVEDNTIHAFYLQASRSLDPEERHHVAKIGHATASRENLLTWKEKGIVLKPSQRHVDDLALWTGNIFKKDAVFYQFYTARSKDAFWIQKICLATSGDLNKWKKSSKNPILEADPKWYRMNNLRTREEDIMAWRDPNIFEDPKSGQIYMTISANTHEKSRYSGCIAIAKSLSDDLTKWEVLPPLFAPGIYAEMEVSQIIFYKNFYYLFFNTWVSKTDQKFARKNNMKGGGLQCYFSEKLFGEYKYVNKSGIVTDNASLTYGVYGIKIIDKVGDRFIAMGWLNKDDKGKFIGTFSKPFTIKIEGDQVRIF